MKTLRQKGEVVEFTAGAAYSSGDPLVLGGRMALVVASVGNGDQGEAAVEGVHEVNKVSAQAWTDGERIYWDPSLAKFTNVLDTDTIFAGVAVGAAANPSSTGYLALNEGVPQAAVQAASVAADVATIVTDFNALLAKLKAAGLMAKS